MVVSISTASSQRRDSTSIRVHSVWEWLKERAGYNRILPFENGAAYYISRYIGRDANKADWGFRVGEMESVLPVAKEAPGRIVLVPSVAVPKTLFHTGLKSRKR